MLEEKCELEEAENDSRLKAQQLDHQCKVQEDQNKSLLEELEVERNNRAMLEDEIADLRSKELEHVNDSEYYEALIQRWQRHDHDQSFFSSTFVSIQDMSKEFSIWKKSKWSFERNSTYWNRPVASWHL